MKISQLSPWPGRKGQPETSQVIASEAAAPGWTLRGPEPPVTPRLNTSLNQRVTPEAQVVVAPDGVCPSCVLESSLGRCLNLGFCQICVEAPGLEAVGTSEGTLNLGLTVVVKLRFGGVQIRIWCYQG